MSNTADIDFNFVPRVMIFFIIQGLCIAGAITVITLLLVEPDYYAGQLLPMMITGLVVSVIVFFMMKAFLRAFPYRIKSNGNDLCCYYALGKQINTPKNNISDAKIIMNQTGKNSTKSYHLRLCLLSTINEKEHYDIKAATAKHAQFMLDEFNKWYKS